jgi:hypothetical protein
MKILFRCDALLQEFTFWNRRHHCRKCGSVVCSDHLQKKQVIPHIHKTTPQKVCDNCFMGKIPAGGMPKPIAEEKPAVNTMSASYVSAPQAPKVVSPAPVVAPASPTPPAKPARPTSMTKPPKPTKAGDAVPSLQDLSVQDALAAPQYSPAKPTTAPPPLPSSPPPPVPTSAPPPLPSSAPPQPPVATGDAEDAPAPASVTPTRRGSVGKCGILDTVCRTFALKKCISWLT